MNLTPYNSYSAIWFDDKCYGVVVSKSIDGEFLYSQGKTKYFKKT